jgi:acylphosphatase
MTDRTACDVVVRGEVQGVFFRDSCRAEADAAGVDGWVSNERDGSVRAHFEGSPEAVDRLVSWVRHGPRLARVEQVDVEAVEPDGCSGFRVR